jgi:hypothetical protein
MTWRKQSVYMRGPYHLGDAYFRWRRKTSPGWRLQEYESGWQSVLIRLAKDHTAAEFASGGLLHIHEEARYEKARPTYELQEAQAGVWDDRTAQALQRSATLAEWNQHVRVPEFYRMAADSLAQARHLTAWVQEPFFRWLDEDDALKKAVARVSLHAAVEDAVMAPTLRHAPAKRVHDNRAAPPVIIGVIDYGLAFAHRRFRNADKETRIEYLWSQDGTAIDGGSVDYGRELTKLDIDKLIHECADEDEVYRKASSEGLKTLAASVARRAAHGTHVMDAACGYEISERDSLHRPIIGVQLPALATADTSGNSLDAFALDGIRYILDRANRIAQNAEVAAVPVVINFSYGDVAGSHDGSSNLEEAIDELVEAYPSLDVVVPAGNSHLARLHARMVFQCPERPVRAGHSAKSEKQKSRRTAFLHWHVLPDDRTASFLELWLPRRPPSDQARVKLYITPPGHEESAEPIEDAGWEQVLQWTPYGSEEVLCEARYAFVDEPTGRGMFLVSLPPTQRIDGTFPCTPSGRWILRLEDHGLDENDAVEAWIQRDDTPFGFPRRGRQSYFEDAWIEVDNDEDDNKGDAKDNDEKAEVEHERYERYDDAGRAIETDDPGSILRRAGSMNAIATGRHTIVVGGYLRTEDRPAPYSAGGPIGRTHRRGPDVMAASDDSVVRPGIMAAGTRSGSVVRMNGTSVAAPQWTRWIADQRANAVLSAGTASQHALVAGSSAGANGRPGGRDLVALLAENLQSAANLETVFPTIRTGSGPVEFPPIRGVKTAEP